jgi:hypothetical protein
MKTLHHICTAYLLLLMMTAQVKAQDALKVEIESQPSSTDAQAIFFVDIPQATQAQVEKDWLRYVGRRSKGRSSVNAGQHMQVGAVNKNVSAEPFDVGSKVVGTPSGVRLSAWLTRNGLAFVNKESVTGQDLAVKKYLRDFAVAQYRSAVRDELKAEQSKLKDMERSMVGLEKSGDKSGRAVSSNERSKERTGKAMETSQTDIDQKSARIEGQKEMLDATASDPNANKGANKTMNEMKGERKDLEKLNESQGKSMDDLDVGTRQAERQVALSLQGQAAMQERINAQRAHVRAVQAKLNAIR